MFLSIQIYRHFCYVFLSLVLVHCGGGSVNIHNLDGPEGLRPAKRVVEELELAPDEALSQKLQELHGSRGDNLDWASFWQLMDRSPALGRALRVNESALLELQFRACEVTAFRSYASTLVHHQAGFEYLVGKKRSCMVSVSAENAAAVLKSAVAGGGFAATTPEQVCALSDFLVDEVKKDSSRAWKVLLDPRTNSDLEWLAARLIEEAKSPEKAAELATVFHNILGTIPFASLLAEKIYEQPEMVNAFVRSLGYLETLHFISHIPASFYPEKNTGRDSFLPVWKVLLAPAFQVNSARGSSFAEFTALRGILLKQSIRWEIGERLEELEHLQLAFEKWFKQQPKEKSREVLFSYFDSSDERLVAEVIRIGSRLFINEADTMRKMHDRWKRLSASFSDPVDQIIYLQAGIHVPLEMSQKKANVVQLCRLFEVYGKMQTSIADSELKGLLEHGLSPGCYSIAKGAAGNSIHIKSSQNLKSSYYSILAVDDMDLTLSAQSIDMGVIDLSATLTHPDLEILATPASHDAIVLPLVLAVVQPKSTQHSYKGVHFLTFHTVVKAADNGPADPREPLIGFRGGNLTILSEGPSNFGFVSLGGEGQRAAPPREGGKGDFSQMDVDKIDSWVNELSALDKNQVLKKHGQYFFRPFLYPEMNTDFFENALRSDKNQIQVFGYAEFIDELSEYQRKKFKSACELLGSPVTDNLSLEKCIEEHLAPLALQQWEQSFDRHGKTLGPKEVLDIVDAQMKFSVPAAEAGSVRENGERGPSGHIFFKESVE